MYWVEITYWGKALEEILYASSGPYTSIETALDAFDIDWMEVPEAFSDGEALYKALVYVDEIYYCYTLIQGQQNPS